MSKIENADPAKKALHVKAADGQSEDILDVQAYDGTSYFKINKDGIVTILHSDTVGVQYIIDGGGSAILTGSKGYVEVPFNATITGWTVVGDQTGNIVMDVKRCTYANFPTTSSIAGSEKPTLSSARKNQDLSLSTWTTSIISGDILEFVVDSASTVTRVTLSIRMTRSV